MPGSHRPRSVASFAVSALMLSVSLADAQTSSTDIRGAPRPAVQPDRPIILSEDRTTSGGDSPPNSTPVARGVLAKPAVSNPVSGVDWRSVGNASTRFLFVMHAFRWATEPGTRQGGLALGRPYLRSAANLHGWADGDPFYVNFVGHPMQGAVAGRLLSLNDHKYRHAEFGRSAPYWKGKLRSAAFAWAFSTQFEIGPFSEASIGHVQRDFPQQGFVDHVVTPTVGLAWMVAEDALDQYGIKWLEGRTRNKFVRIVARSGLNPTRSFANLLSGKAPWSRDSRPGVLKYEGEGVSPLRTRQPQSIGPEVPAPFEFTAASSLRQFGETPCGWRRRSRLAFEAGLADRSRREWLQNARSEKGN